MAANPNHCVIIDLLLLVSTPWKPNKLRLLGLIIAPDSHANFWEQKKVFAQDRKWSSQASNHSHSGDFPRRYLLKGLDHAILGNFV